MENFLCYATKTLAMHDEWNEFLIKFYIFLGENK